MVGYLYIRSFKNSHVLRLDMKAVGLISGGIDSPAAMYIMSKKYEIILIHLDNSPYAPKIVKKKVLKLSQKLAEITKKNIKLYIVPHGENLKDFLKVERKFNCILCRRMMYRLANEIAKKEKAKFLITGESLAQVASQTLSNMKTEDSVSEIPILRPLLGLDKEEITKIASKIGTYEISIEKEQGCVSAKGRPMCCYATPVVPATKSDINKIEEIERKVDIEGMVKRSIDNCQILTFK